MDTLLNKVIDKNTKYLALVKDSLAPQYREKLEKGQLRLNAGLIFHIAEFSVLSGTVDLIQPNHKSGTGESSLIDGKLQDKIFVLDFFYLRYKNAPYKHGGSWYNMALHANSIGIPDAVVEFYLNDRLQLRTTLSALHERPIVKGNFIPEYGDVQGLNLRRPIVITPDDKLQFSIKLPQDVVANPSTGYKFWIWLGLFGSSAKIR